MEFRILGPLEVVDDGTVVSVATGKQCALLADLLLHANRTVSIERLVDDLWGDEPPPTAVKAVQVYVSKLRKALADGRLQTRGGGYQLDVAEGELDLARFERLHAAGRAALEDGRADDALRDLEAALALWRGPALAEFDEPFAVMETARLEEARLTCAEDRIDAELALGRQTALVGELEAVVARHPLRERPREQLMLALYRSGRHAEALATYQAFRRTLGEQLGIDPSPRLRALETQMLRQDEALEAPPRVRTQPVTDRAGGGHLARAAASERPIGRDDELALLHRNLDAALEGERRIVFVTGEPGAGKTTLVERFLVEASARAPAWIGRGQCVEHRGSGEPYLPLLEAVQRLVRSDDDGTVFELLRRRAPTWLVQLPWLVDEDLIASLQPQVLGVTRERMLREMCEALDALAAERPVALVLEDLHWSDPSTLDLVDAIARRYEPARLLVIGTLRAAAAEGGSDALRTFVHGLRVRGLCTVIGVGSLSVESARSYLERRLGGEDLGSEVAAVLHARSRGNPLFMEKLVDAWLESGALTNRTGAWAVDGALDVLQRDVPETLRELIEQRLATVDDGARDVLRAASIAGAEFSAALAAAAADVTLETAERALERLAADGAFVEATGEERWPDGTIATRYAFTHDLCHEVLSEGMPPGARARVHHRIGVRLAEAFGERAHEIAAALAWHFSHGREPGRAVEFLRIAAIQALDRRAPREALHHLEEALRVLGDHDSGEQRSRHEHAISLLRARALIETEGWSSVAAEASLERAVELAADIGTAELVLALHRLATLHEVRGEYARSESLLTESVGLGGEGLQPHSLVDTHELLACSLFHQGDFARAHEHAERALSYYDGEYANRVTAAFGENPGVSCHGWSALASWYLGRPDRATERADSAVAASTVGTRLHARAMAQAQAAQVAQAGRDVANTRVWADAAMASAAESGFPYWQAMGMALHGWALAHDGDAAGGIREIEEGIARSRAMGAHMDDAYYLGLLAEAALQGGLVDRGLTAVDEALANDPTERSFFFAPELHRLRGELLAAGGDHDAAMESLGRALAEARRLGSPPLELRAAVAVARRAPTPEAGEAVAAALASLPSTAETADTQEARALLADLGVPERTRAATAARRRGREIRYARSGDLNIAFEVTGDGPPDIVLVPGFVSHLEKDWEEPRHARFLERLASVGRLIRFDKRGTGLSDRPPDLPDLETRMDDLRAVMDAAGSERATLLGYSEGGPLAVLFATAHPERVERLVLYGSYAKRIDPDDDYPWAQTGETRKARIEAMEADWGLEANLRDMCPSADEELARWWGERARAAASPGAVRALMEMNSLIDVRDLLPTVHVPTLVAHRAGDRTVLVEEGRYLADRIPDARLVELPGADHFVAVDPDQIVDAIEPFLRGDAAPESTTPASRSERVLATILLTDIVSSTETAVRLGDSAWAELLDRHHELLRQEVARFRGEEMDAVGDGFMALFDGPARAIRCADAITRRVRTLGLNVRAGVHTGEIERVDGTARGVAVHVAARISSAAAPGQVLVSATTRDLVAGSGLALEDAGQRELKGLDEPRRLFAVRS